MVTIWTIVKSLQILHPFCSKMYLSICMSIPLSACLSTYLCVHPSIHPSIHPSVRPSVHPSIHPPINLFILYSTADDPGPKTVKVCSPLDDDCCGSWESTILVKFCPSAEEGDGDGFYVYRLKRVPHCDMAYCAGNSVVCTGESVWNPVRKECTG